MSSKTPDIIKALVQGYLDGREDAVWQHKQSGQWLIKHRDLEIVAAKAGIQFDIPVVLESDAAKSIAIVVVGRLPNITDGTTQQAGRMEWSIGEASPKNTQQAYPYAMAEKRAKDRVILKLMQVHGHVYSEDEMVDEQTTRTSKSTGEDPNAKKALATLDKAVAALTPLDGVGRANWFIANPKAVEALRWVSRNFPQYMSRLEDLGVTIPEPTESTPNV